MGLVGLFALLAIAELLFGPADRKPMPSNDRRLMTNFGLTAMVLVTGSLLPLARMTASIGSERFGGGLAQLWHMPWAAILVASLLLDSLATYWLHRLMHVAPALWRFHRVHHADSAVDVSTSLRNHPLELLVMAPPAMLLVVLLGTPASIILVTQTLSMAAAFWTHADLKLPGWLERPLSIAIVTPSLHRVHHSRERTLHDSNFGDWLIVWDQVFGTLKRTSVPPAVGLANQRARDDRLLQQILSPLHPA